MAGLDGIANWNLALIKCVIFFFIFNLTTEVQLLIRLNKFIQS